MKKIAVSIGLFGLILFGIGSFNIVKALPGCPYTAACPFYTDVVFCDIGCTRDCHIESSYCCKIQCGYCIYEDGRSCKKTCDSFCNEH